MTFYIDVPPFRKLPKIINDERITEDMGVACRLDNPQVQKSPWYVTTHNGWLSIRGQIKGTTSATLKVGYGVGGLYELLNDGW